MGAQKKFTLVLTAKDKATTTLKKVGNSSKELNKSFSSLGAVLTTGIAAVGFTKFIGLAQVQLGAQARLSATLKTLGISYDDVSESIAKTTSALQDKTTFGDEEQIAALTTLTTVTQDFDKSMAALPSVLDLAAFAQSDLNSAARLFSRALDGDVEALFRVLPSLRDLKKEGKSTEEIMKVFTETIKGQAEALGKTSPLKQFQNILGDIGEVLGTALLPIMTALVKIFKKFGTENIAIVVGLAGMAVALVKLIPLIKSMTLAFVASPIGIFAVAVGLLTVGFLALRSSLRKTNDEQKLLNDAQSNNLKTLGEFEEALKLINAQLTKLSETGSKDFFGNLAEGVRLESIRSKIIENTEVLKTQIEIKKKAAEKEKKDDDEAKARTERAIKLAEQRAIIEGESQEKLFNKISEIRKKAEQEEKALREKRLEEEEIFNQNIIQQNQELTDFQFEQGQISNEQFIETLEARKALLQEQQESDLAGVENFALKIAQIEAKITDLKKQEIAKRKAAQEFGLTSSLSILTNLASINKNASRENFAVFKAASIAEATVAGFLAATKALTLGPIIGLIAAGAIGAATAANLAGIIAQSPPSFQTDEGQFRVVPGPRNQPVPAIVHGGETIGRPSMGTSTITIMGDVFNTEETANRIGELLFNANKNTGLPSESFRG